MADLAENPDGIQPEASDMHLTTLAQQGDGTAFELIVRRYNQALFRAARAVLNDKDLAQEAIQEAYLNAFTHLDAFQCRSSLKTWLTRIVINQAINLKRRQQPVVSLTDRLPLMHPHHSAGGDMTPLTSTHNNPEDAASRDEIKVYLEAAVQRLPEIYRCVFMLRDVEELSVTDTAFCLNISEVLVRKRLSRAREILNRELMRSMQTSTTCIFEFAGSRCNAVTTHVMTELARQKMIRQR